MSAIIYENSACKVCRAASNFCCQRCQELYCSVECQQEDWREHKYFCVPMPKLQKLSVTNVTEQRHINKNPYKTTLASKPSPIKQNEYSPSIGKSLSNKWQQCMEPPIGKLFDVVVQSVSKGPESIVWVLYVGLQDSLQKFIQYTNEQFTTKKPVTPSLLNVGDLVVVKYDNNYCRAKVEKLQKAIEAVEVRLLDLGYILSLPRDKLLMPSQFMREEKCYAIGICLEEPLDSDAFNKTITIRIDDIKQKGNGYYVAHMFDQSFPKFLPIDNLVKRPQVELTKLFADKQYALLKVQDSFNLIANMSACLDKAEDAEYNFTKPPAIGAFVAAYVDKFWIRARLLAYNVKDNFNLVYDLDNGVVSQCSQLKEIPLPYRHKPISVFGIVSTAPLYELHKLAIDKPLSLKLPENLQNRYVAQTQASLYAADDMLCNVICHVFTGLPEDLSMSYFEMEIGAGSDVYITHILTYNEFYVNRINCKKNIDFFNKIAGESSRISELDKLRAGDVVLYSNAQNNYQRGKVISVMLSVNECCIFNIDTGATETVNIKQLAKANEYIRCRPVYLHKVKFDNFASKSNSQAALQLLQQHYTKATEFIIQYDENNEIVLCSTQKPHKEILSKKILQLLCAPVSVRNTELVTPRKLSYTNSDGSVEELCKNMAGQHLAPKKHFDDIKNQTPKASAQNTCHTREDSSHNAASSIPKMKTYNVEPSLLEAAVKPTCRKLFKSFSYTDLKVEPLLIGENVQLLALDISSLAQGYISAGNARDRGLTRQILNEHHAMVLKICKEMRNSTEGYKPKVNDMCIVFDNDTEKWYRGWCMAEVSEKVYHLMNIDYGNMTKVRIENLFPITEDLMFPCLANMLYIEDLTEEITKPLTDAIRKHDFLLKGRVEKVADDAFSIKIHDIRNYIENC